MTIPINSINTKEPINPKDLLNKENKRLKDYNTKLKLEIIDVKEKLHKILTIINK